MHSVDWFVSIGLTPVSFALTGPVSSVIGVETTLVVAAIVPSVVCVALFAVARLRRDEERGLGDYAGAASASRVGSGTPAIS